MWLVHRRPAAFGKPRGRARSRAAPGTMREGKVPNGMLLALYVSSFLAQVPAGMNFALSVSDLARPPALPLRVHRGSSLCGASAVQYEKRKLLRELRMSFGPEDPEVQDAASPRSHSTGGQLWGSGKTNAGRSCQIGNVVRVKPAADNGWHKTRKVLAQESTFVHALMYRWPTSWLRAERRLNQLARDLRDEAPSSIHEGEQDDSKSDAEDPDIPFDVGERYRVAGRAGCHSSTHCRRALAANACGAQLLT